MRIALLLALSSVEGLQVLPSEGLEITHPEPKFSVRIPGGFRVARSTLPETLYQYRRIHGTRVDDGVDVLVARNAKELKPEDLVLKAEELRPLLAFPIPPFAELRANRRAWNGIEIPVLESRYARQDGRRMLCISALFPLAPKAVELHVMGPLEYAQELALDFEKVIPTFKSSALASRKNGGLLTGILLGAGAGLLVLYGVVHALWFRHGTAPPAVRRGWLVVTMLLFAAGMAVSFNILQPVGVMTCIVLLLRVKKEGAVEA